MGPLSRRTFSKSLFAGLLLPATKLRLPELQEQSEQSVPLPATMPDTIAGYTLTPDDKKLVVKFLESHEKNMTPLRKDNLPNTLVPDILFTSPLMKKGEGE